MGWNRSDESWRADYERDQRRHDFEPLPPRLDKRQVRAVCVLIAAAEAICEAGLLGTKTEMVLREQVAEALSAFNFNAADRAERAALT
jgi:hypothetical protein